jgi:coatomer subunit beta'
MYHPAHEYISHVDRSHLTLVEVFKNMQIDGEEPLENGDADHEVHSAYIFYIYLVENVFGFI